MSMDHRIIQLETGQVILLDRIPTGDPQQADWQVIISTYVNVAYRYDDWVNFDDPLIAQSFIVDYSERSAIRFRKQAEEAYLRLLNTTFKVVDSPLTVLENSPPSSEGGL